MTGSKRKKPFEIVFKLLVLCLCGYGIASDAIQNGSFNPYAFAYFTIISNSAAFLYLLAGLLRALTRGSSDPRPGSRGARGMILTALFLLILVYWTALASSGARVFTMPNLTIHLLVPILFFADWILFDRRERWPANEPPRWLGMIFCYCVFVFLLPVFGLTFQNGSSRYPYPFFDVDALGLGKVLLAMGLLHIAFLFIGYVIWSVNNILWKASRLNTGS